MKNHLMGLRFRMFCTLSIAIAVVITGCGDDAVLAPSNGGATNASENEKPKSLAHTYGSFVLTYEMRIAGGADTDEEIDEAIVAIARRIDPQDVTGLKFRNLGDGRLEVRGPMPPPEVLSLREALVAAIDHLMSKGVSRAEIEQSLYRRIESERKAGMKVLIERHPSLANEIRAVFDAFESHNRKRGPYPDVEAVINMLRPRGELEFRIAPEPSLDLQGYQDELRKNGPDAPADDPYRWFEVGDVRAMLHEPGDRERLDADAPKFFAAQGVVGAAHAGGYYILLSNQIGERLTSAEGDWRVESAHLSRDPSGRASVFFSLDASGARRLGDLTQRHRGRPLGMVLDGRSLMVAIIQDKIEKDVALSLPRHFSEADGHRLVDLLDAGSLRARLSPAPISIDIVPAP